MQLHNYDQGFKRIDYDFDLVSGKVDAVYYQKASTDQFTHRYEYDEDNRLISVKTSLIGTSRWPRVFHPTISLVRFFKPQRKVLKSPDLRSTKPLVQVPVRWL